MAILSLIFSLFNQTIFKINIQYIFYFLDILIIVSFAIWGLLIFQYKTRGKPLYLWGLALDFLFLIMFLFETIVGVSTFFLRVFHLTLIIIIIGFVSYLYKLIKNNSFQKRKFKLFLIFIVGFSISTSYYFDSTAGDTFFLKEQEVNSIQWYSNYTSEEKDKVFGKLNICPNKDCTASLKENILTKLQKKAIVNCPYCNAELNEGNIKEVSFNYVKV